MRFDPAQRHLGAHTGPRRRMDTVPYMSLTFGPTGHYRSGVGMDSTSEVAGLMRLGYFELRIPDNRWRVFTFHNGPVVAIVNLTW